MDRLTKVPFAATLKTDGSGYWSEHKTRVDITHLQVPYMDRKAMNGELCVYFDTTTWDIEQYGLIYTDERWLKDLIRELEDAGFDASDIGYSEQGMQGRNFVSLDVGKDFLASWKTQTEAAI